MYYYGARYYDPRLSIFISVDPLAEQTFEPYSYVGNNPIMFTDPTGMSKEWPGDEFETKDEAAKDFANEYNSVSIQLNAELSSDLYSYKREGRRYYSYNIPQGNLTEGDEKNPYGSGSVSSSESFPNNLSSFEREGDIHTHGKELQIGDNVPSEHDFYTLELKKKSYGSQYDRYVVVPSGNLLKITDIKMQTYDVIDNKIPNDPNSKLRNNTININSIPKIAPILHVWDKKGYYLRSIQGTKILNNE